MQELAERQLLPGGGRGRGRGKGRGKGGRGKEEKNKESNVETPCEEPKPDEAVAPEPEPKRRRTRTPKAGRGPSVSKGAKAPVPANSLDPCNEPIQEEPKSKSLKETKAAESAPPMVPGTEVEAAPFTAASKNQKPLEDPSNPPATDNTEESEHSEHGESCWNKHGQHQKAKVARRERAQEALKQIRESGIPELVDRVQGDFRRVILICILSGAHVRCNKNCFAVVGKYGLLQRCMSYMCKELHC